MKLEIDRVRYDEDGKECGLFARKWSEDWAGELVSCWRGRVVG